MGENDPVTTAAIDRPQASNLGQPRPAAGPLRIGPYVAQTPVVLAPMAGITNQAFRRLCREQLAATGGQGIFVSEMVTSRALIERNAESLRLIQHDPDEYPRSVQLYGVDPGTVGACVRMLLDEGRADHIDLNFGCPVPKVTRKGGGAALPWKTQLFEAIVGQAVTNAEPYGVPVTIKMRKGIDPEHLSFLDAGRIAEAQGAAAVSLHGRTAADYYAGHADWEAIAELKRTVTSIPVLGNGDIWSADDAARMMEQTGCDGVVVGRGCLGRPWLFADLAAAMKGDQTRVQPGLDAVISTIRRHIELLAQHFTGYERGNADKRPASAMDRACRDIRKHMAWYLKGYSIGQSARQALATVESLGQFDEITATLDQAQGYPGEPAEGPRGRAGSPRSVALPAGWLDGRDLDDAAAAELHAAELAVSGG